MLTVLTENICEELRLFKIPPRTFFTSCLQPHMLVLYPVLCANFKGIEIIFYSHGWKACIITTNSSGEAASVCSCNDILVRDVSLVSDWQSGRLADSHSAFPECSVLTALIWEQLKDKAVECDFYSSIPFCL